MRKVFELLPNLISGVILEDITTEKLLRCVVFPCLHELEKRTERGFRGSIQPRQPCHRSCFFAVLHRLVGNSTNKFFEYRLDNHFAGEICTVAHNGNTEAGLGMPPHMRAETGVPAGVIEEFTKFGIPPIMQPVAIAFITHRLGICRSFVEYPWVLYCLQHGIMTCQHVTAQTPVPCSS